MVEIEHVHKILFGCAIGWPVGAVMLHFVRNGKVQWKRTIESWIDVWVTLAVIWWSL